MKLEQELKKKITNGDKDKHENNPVFQTPHEWEIRKELEGKQSRVNNSRELSTNVVSELKDPTTLCLAQ